MEITLSRETIQEETLKFIFGLLTLVITWGVGSLLLSKWELQKKAREMDLTIATQFQQLFGEFKEIWRLWKMCEPEPDEVKERRRPLPPAATQWELLARASNTEGRVEAVLLKLATDRTLDEQELKTLGLFRQAFQVLRQGIQNKDWRFFGYKDPKYRQFNELSCQVAHLVAGSASHARPSAAAACDAFRTIIEVSSEELAINLVDMQARIEKQGKRRYFPPPAPGSIPAPNH